MCPIGAVSSGTRQVIEVPGFVIAGDETTSNRAMWREPWHLNLRKQLFGFLGEPTVFVPIAHTGYRRHTAI